MSAIGMILTSIAALSLSGAPALFGSRSSLAGQRCTVGMLALGSGLGLCGVWQAMRSEATPSLVAAWQLPIGQFAVSIDAISAVFLLPIFVVPVLGAFFGLEYWKQTEHQNNGRRLGLVYGLLAGAMALVVIARDAVLFLIAWEMMAIAAFFAATSDDEDPAVRRAGWIYLIATHLGTLCLIAMFAMWRYATGSFLIQPPTALAMQPAIPTVIFSLALIGFGLKAGLMPLHVWLPGAHASAPSHVSAVMSGVMLKMGVYGIVRFAALLPTPPASWGGTLLGIGAVTGILGIAFAIGQQDLKRLLAYSSIENIGIITMGVGLALLGRSLDRPDWIVLGLGGAMFHVWSHSLIKSLLFLNAGAIIHGVHTRNIDRMGGLARKMPRTSLWFLLGAVAICGLPPLNGFVGEWLIYLGFLRTIGSVATPEFPVAGLGAAVLATIGALSAACFVKLYGGMFLGAPRSNATDTAHDPGAKITIPIALLAVGCVMLGLAPIFAMPMLDRACAAWSGVAGSLVPSVQSLAPINWIVIMAWILILVLCAATALAGTSLRWRRRGTAGTWDCGYAQPTPRMQYTASSFAQSLVGLFDWILTPKIEAAKIHGLFPLGEGFKTMIPDTILDHLVLPVFQAAGRFLSRLRLFQHGSIQVYIVYFLAALLALLLWGGFGE